MSLQSLARSTRGVGVTDLREALEGRNSMSNPNLTKAPSISTLDHASSFVGSEAHHRPPSRPRSRKGQPTTAPGEVKDMLNKLGIGKQNRAVSSPTGKPGTSSLLKVSFPSLQKDEPQ
jgi:protein EFR3